MARSAADILDAAWDTADAAKRQKSIELIAKGYPEATPRQQARMRAVLERWRETLAGETEGVLYQQVCRLLEQIGALPPTGKRVNQSQRLTKKEKPERQETKDTVVEVPRKPSLTPKGTERESVPTGKEHQDETEPPGFVEREQQRRGPGRPKQQREPIRWQEVEQLWAKAVVQHTQAVEQFQALLDNLAGTAGDSPDENRALAKAIKKLADRLGVDLTINDKTVNVIWNGVFIARAKGTDQETQDSSAGFPRLNARPSPPSEEVDIASWASRAKAAQKDHGVRPK